MTICTGHVHCFSRQSSIGTCQILEGMCWIPWKTDRKNASVITSYFCMLPHLQIGFGNDLGRGLCAWRCKYSAWIAETLAANESSKTLWTARDWIRGDVARKKTTRSTIQSDTHSTWLFEIFSTKPWDNSRWTLKGFGWITMRMNPFKVSARFLAPSCFYCSWCFRYLRIESSKVVETPLLLLARQISSDRKQSSRWNTSL